MMVLNKSIIFKQNIINIHFFPLQITIKMTSLKSYTFNLVVFLLLATIATTQSQECPLDCTCSPSSNSDNTTPYNHAKCTSLEGLRQLGKTSSIQSLDCSFIGITKITNQLEKLTNLTHLDLSNNRLSEVTKLSKRIKTLDLSHNRITSGKLSKIPQYVQHLNLSYNEITYLPLDMKNLKNLKSIELLGNPINCTCETLQVRNWLQINHVWTDNLVICSNPMAYKGKPWLQIKENELCGDSGNGGFVSVTYNLDESENELMQNDSPSFGSSELFDEGTIENDFIRISKRDLYTDLDYAEGSGSDDNVTQSTVADDEEGSGGGLLPLVAASLDHNNDTSEEPVKTSTELESVSSSSPEPAILLVETTTEEIIPDIAKIGTNLNIFDGNNVEATSEVVKNETIENPNSRMSHSDNNNDVKPIVNNVAEEEAKTSSTAQTQSTYILLIILGVLLVGLIIMVAMRKKKPSSSVTGKNDPENPLETELLDMNKQLIGKPVGKNGNGNVEIVPFGNRDQWNGKKPSTNGNRVDPNDLKKEEEPLLQKLNAPDSDEAPTKLTDPNTEKETNNNVNGNLPLTENTPESTAAPASPPQKYRSIHDPNADEVFIPISPKPCRYSPVYSPETGRVKIKLTETPKPIAPTLVTRSRSNGGEFITTKSPTFRRPHNETKPPSDNAQ